MGWVRSQERRWRRRLLRAGGWFLRAAPMSLDQISALAPRRVLVVRQHNQMGDMMLATAAFRALKETWPGAYVAVVGSNLNSGVLEHSPFLDRVFIFDKRSLAGHARLLRALRQEKFDLAIALHTVSFSFTTLMLAVLSGARVRIGSTSRAIGDALTGSYLNCTLPLPDERELAAMNEAEHNLYPLRAAGITTSDLSPRLVPPADARARARVLAAASWPGGTLRVAVHPGAGKTENIWPAERFAEVVDGISRRCRISLIVIEGPADAEPVRRFVDACRLECDVVRGWPIADVAALMQLADLVICNDTGVMHVAAAAGARTLAVFGPTDPVRWAPRSESLHIVRSHDGSLESVTPADVADRAVEILVALAQRDAQR